jgi:ankyrin repeat protein
MNTPQSVWNAAENAVVAGDLVTLERLLREHEPLFREQRPQSSWSGGLAPDYSGADARCILAREHNFGSFDELAEHLEALKRTDSPVTKFEAAVDATVAGEAVALERLLRQNAELIHSRSTRKHRSTLLHYVGANGVEGWRQRAPRNAVQVVEILLNAGAEVDAMADMYGGSTTLGLVATSIHPLLAGVQNDLIDTLLNHGAAMDHPQGAGNGHGIVNGCLANGRPGAAEFLASRGARLDLEGAAGVGRLDAVRSFFNEAGGLKANATRAQMKSGFQWACQYGRTRVVDLLLERGIEVGEMHRGQTGLHWAAYGGHLDIVKLLLGRNAPVNVKDETWQNTPLGWALYGWANPPEAGRGGYYEVVALLVGAGSTIEPEWIPNEKVRTDSRMLATLRGELPATQSGEV